MEYQKRKKIYHNDIVEYNGEILQVIIDEDIANNLVENTAEHVMEETVQIAQELTPTTKLKQTKNKSTKKAAPTTEGTAKNSKRKPISF